MGEAAHGDGHHEHAMLMDEKALVQSVLLVFELLCILFLLVWTWSGSNCLLGPNWIGYYFILAHNLRIKGFIRQFFHVCHTVEQFKIYEETGSSSGLQKGFHSGEIQ
jgi:hypothetical protein